MPAARFDWLHPFPVLTGIGLVLGYALLGAGWLVFKTEGALRDWAYARIPWLVAGVFVVLALAVHRVADDRCRRASLRATFGCAAGGWSFRCSASSRLFGVSRRRAGATRRMAVRHDGRCSSCAAFLTLAVMFWPYMIPYSITVADAAAPEASLRFLFYGGIVVLPVIAAYTIGVYWVFRGKIDRFEG